MKLVTFAFFVVATSASGALAACSNATNGDTGLPGQDAAASGEGGGSGADGGATDASNAGKDAGSPPLMDGSQPTSDGGVDTNEVVINEISGKGVNWIELYNAGSSTLDLSDYRVAHESKDGGGVDMNSASKLPSGTTLASGQYAIVAELPDDAGPQTSPPCPDGGEALCLGCTFGVSNSDGTIVYVLDPSKNVSSQVAYPANVVQGGQTWGRVPNGTGAFQTNLPTPGEANVAN